METAVIQKQDIRKTTAENLKTFLVTHGEQGFRAKQILEWLWKKSARSFDEMTNLSKKTRELLDEHFEIRPLSVSNMQISQDKTIKSAFRLFDGKLIEGVLIPADDRMTACVSSQVGCSLTCKFCATGYMDRERNLDPAEIYDQVVTIRDQAEKHYQQPLSNIVYMGMGEPLLNYANVLKSVDYITSPEGLGMSPKRITVSTAGIAKMITKLGDDNVKFNLALSLHAANDSKRNQIMPINETNTLVALRDALKYFYKKTGNKITLEYILFYNFNDSEEDARELWNFAKQVPAVHINIIEYNPIENASYKNTDPQTLARFARSHPEVELEVTTGFTRDLLNSLGEEFDLVLATQKAGPQPLARFARFIEQKGIPITVRRSRGKDIDAACGQLAGKTQ